MATNLDVGTKAFLLSRKWYDKYLAFICADQFKNNATESELQLSSTHFQDKNPGPILNHHDLCEVDKQGENLFGTGEQKGMEADFMDAFVDNQLAVNKDFLCINQDLWQFLFARYGGQVV